MGSDIDIFVYGDNIPSITKVEGILLIRDLNYKFGLRLEKVPIQHWTPIYIDTPQRRRLRMLSEEEIVREFTECLRRIVKGLGEQGLLVTHKKWWELVEYCYKFPPFLPLPPPYPPIPKEVFLKLL